jgi:hypothetical protein
VLVAVFVVMLAVVLRGMHAVCAFLARLEKLRLCRDKGLERESASAF